MLAYASRGTELRPGDVIGSGTVGTGCLLELSGLHGSERYPWLRPGDVVTVEIEQLGADHRPDRPWSRAGAAVLTAAAHQLCCSHSNCSCCVSAEVGV